MTSVILTVPDISCDHCERTIREALTPLKGVQRVDVNITAKQVRVTYDETQVAVEKMKAVLQQEGYPAAS